MMTLFESVIGVWWFPWVVGGTFLAGFVRGMAGFGGALVLIPILSIFLGPAAAVPILNIVDAVAAAPLLPRATRQCRWPEVLPLLLGAVILLPFGGLMLKTVDPDCLRRATAVTLLVVVSLMASGRTLIARRTASWSAAIGALSGLMAGSIGLSGPPIALFWLDKNVAPLVSRANVIVYTALITGAVIMMTWWANLFNQRIMVISVILIPVYAGGIYGGGHSFHRMPSGYFRPLVLTLIAIVAVGTFFH